MTEECRACGATPEPFAEGVVLTDVTVTYVRCPSCGMVQAVEPTWLDRAYSSAIARLDVGLLDRCVVLSHVTSALLRTERLRGGTFLDWAGGYGTLTRLMRDRGFAFEHFDPLAENIFAPDHQAPSLEGSRYDLVTGFEVLEHLVDPVASLAPVAATTDRLLMSTRLLPDPAPKPDEWDYYTPETGQHITFFTPEALRALAERLGYDGVVVGDLVHLFHRGPVSRSTQRLVRSVKVAYMAGLAASVPDRRHSLLQRDVDALKTG
ncbi:MULTISPECIES: class I SAM-dependent methyltransferase [unclassified Nocardioides]|uniref:class I SAM-dependent methyltransferase n=1 Tax=unclassified Nocardioides TaxID=2615069 RepID=UPI003610C0B7